jgi:serine/threonine-protein kinase
MAREPLAIAYAHKHEPVPALPPDVPQPISELVYEMLAKTPEERPPSARAVADRADMLRDALALGGTAALDRATPPAAYAGMTRADMPAAATGALIGEAGPNPRGGGGGRGGGGRGGNRRRVLTGAAAACLCALAAGIGLYLSGHMDSPAAGDVGSNTSAQHSASPSVSAPGSASASAAPTPHPTLVGGTKPVTSPSPADSPRSSKSAKPTPTHKASPTASASTSASATTSPTATGSPTDTSSPTSSPTPS